MLEINPSNQAVCWSYVDEDSETFKATARGMKQRLLNDNTLIVDPDNGRILEVTRSKELVWLYAFERDPVSNGMDFGLKS